MKLDVFQPSADADELWYADGLRFSCTQCGNCCTGSPGVVWISREEIVRLADHLHLTPEQIVERYCRAIDGKFTLRESRNARGEYDCVFLREETVERTRKQKGGHDERIVHTKRGCAVYPARPLQCRIWPFWSENLASETVWNRSAKRCHGMNHGKKYSLERIAELRDATDWPKNPPTSTKKG